LFIIARVSVYRVIDIGFLTVGLLKSGFDLESFLLVGTSVAPLAKTIFLDSPLTILHSNTTLLGVQNHDFKKVNRRCPKPQLVQSVECSNVGKDMCSSHYREDAAVQCAALMIERTQCAALKSGDGLLWSVATYVRTFHRLHLLRLWTPAI
jgi:hypothetical protein